ncbi:adenine deaminase [Thermodesulfobacteriota bacterium]
MGMNNREFEMVAGGNAPADLILVNANVVNTFTARVEKSNVAISDGKITGGGDFRKAKEIIDLKGRYLAPGFIDGHVHLESSMLNPGAYAKAVVPRGVLSVVTDFHEIANVCGISGIEYILNYARALPMDIFGMAPSCVPATHLETAGARITSEELKEIKALNNIIGLGEMMNYPGVISGDRDILSKIELFRGMIIDGHAPGLSGRDLKSYVSAGIMSDHECTSLEEAEEKLSLGLYIMIREGSSEKNLEALFPLVNDRSFKKCFFVVDDRCCADLLHDGDVDGVVRKAVKMGLDPVRAIQMATINTAEYFRLTGLGAVETGYRANLIVFNELTEMKVSMVFYDGRLVARDGKLVVAIPAPDSSDSGLTHTVNIKPLVVEDLKMPANNKTAPVIEIIPDQILTKRREEEVRIGNGLFLPDTAKDLMKLVVVERHRASGNVGLGIVRGFGLKRGALASTIAHDSHNIIAVGTNDQDIFEAISELERIQGGLTVTVNGKVVDSLALPIAGLLSKEPIEEVARKLRKLQSAAFDLGCMLRTPFDTLSFLALPVIPELRLTDLGMVDVTEFKLLD